MARITNDLDGSATITMSDGTSLRVPGLSNPPNVTAQELRNVCTALFALADNLDERLVKLENRGAAATQG